MGILNLRQEGTPGRQMLSSHTSEGDGLVCPLCLPTGLWVIPGSEIYRSTQRTAEVQLWDVNWGPQSETMSPGKPWT